MRSYVPAADSHRRGLKALLRLLPLFALVPLPIFSSHAYAQEAAGAAAPAATPRVLTRAVWDDRFLYFSFQVEDTDVMGTNAAPMSSPEQDDSVAVYLHTGDPKASSVTSQTHAMVVSAAGGFTFLRGDEVKKGFTPRPLFTIKYGVTQQGSLNRAGDRDRGYTVTLAIPLTELGLDPKTFKPGKEIAFNAVVRARGEERRFTSLSPEVKEAADITDLAKWTRLVFAGPEAQKITSSRTLIAPQVPVEKKPPIIDGTYRAEEWIAAPQVAFASPDIPKKLVPFTPTNPTPVATVNDTVAPTLKSGTPFVGLRKLLMARYVLGFQGDLRKTTAPIRGIFGQDGSIQLSEHPLAGVGPWFSYERTAWHRAQFSEMRRCGIDVALTQIGGAGNATGPSDEKALLVMVAALKELESERVPTPLVAPYLDTTSLLPQGAGKLDMATPAGREALFQAVRRWMNVVPQRYRARVPLPADAAGGRLLSAYPIFLSDAASIANPNDENWADDLRARFAKEFGAGTGGATLLLVGGPGFDAQKAHLSGTFAADTGGPSGVGTNAVSTFLLRPGIDDPNGLLVSRRGGATYQERWDAALSSNANWIILDSWNDFGRGTQIAASRQYGPEYLDMTRLYSIQVNGLAPRAVRWLSQDAPRRLRPGQVVAATFTLQNVGQTIFRAQDGIRLIYRWFRNGQVVAEGPLSFPLSENVLPTRSSRLTVGLAALHTNAEGKLEPLPPGDYVVQVDLAGKSVGSAGQPTTTTAAATETEYDLFSATDAEAALRLPVTITEDMPEAVEFESTTTPTLMLSGGTYPVALRLRWLGSERLLADAAALVYQILSEDGKTTVSTGTIPLARPLQPGQWETVRAVLRLTEGGAPLPAACPEPDIREAAKSSQGSGYQLRWLLTRTQAVESIPGEFVERIAVYPPDDTARVEPLAKVPDELAADQQVSLDVTVINRGAQKWAKGTYRLGYHWYHPDGLEAVWTPPLVTPIDKDVAPGESVKVPVIVRAPVQGGEYLLAFDVYRAPETYLSTRPVSPTGDIALSLVRVSGGRQRYLDLTRIFDIDAVAGEEKPGDGDLDGQGGSLPAESFPPDPYGIAAQLAPNQDKKSSKDDPLYPSGYFTDFSPTARLVWFRYGPEKDGARNALACRGQAVEAKGKFFGLHLAACATGGKDVTVEFTLRYKDGKTEKVSRNIGDWNRPPAEADPIVVSARRKRTPEGDVRAFAGLRHILIPVDVSRELDAVILPDNPAIKVFAITLER